MRRKPRLTSLPRHLSLASSLLQLKNPAGSVLEPQNTDNKITSDSEFNGKPMNKIMTMMDIPAPSTTPLVTPRELKYRMPTPATTIQQITAQRCSIERIINHADNRLLVVLGPCSIHDPKSALEYASNLASIQNKFNDELFLVMRVYLEKPRTTMGWRGLINDPDLNNDCDINRGYAIARKLLLDIHQLGVATGTEFLSMLTPHYIADLTSWAAIGARTVSSPLHRELASGLPMPVGFKNDINGNMQVAVDALNTSQSPQLTTTLSADGKVIITKTSGNPHGHIILRGGINGTNYHNKFLSQASRQLKESALPANRIMVDCSHDNSNKNYLQQLQVIETLCQYLALGTPNLIGVMLESHLTAGKQAIAQNKALTYGQSITDSCIDWDTTYLLLQKLQLAVQQRNSRKGEWSKNT